jgi:hypothetical protein
MLKLNELRLMNLISEKSIIPLLKAGTYIAACVAIIDLGEQHNIKFNKYENKVLFIFELPSETVNIDGEDKPRWLSINNLTFSLNKKSKLAKMLIQWRGKEFTNEELKGKFHISSMLGQGCQIKVTVINKNNKSFNNIQTVETLPLGFPAPVTKNELILFNTKKWDYEVFYKLPEWIQSKIKKSTQYQIKYAQCDTLEFPEEKTNKSLLNNIKTKNNIISREGILF